MIPIDSLTDAGVCRRLVWEIGPGVEQPGFLLSWWKDRIIIAIEQPGEDYVKPVEVAPEDVRWLRARAPRLNADATSGAVSIQENGGGT